MSIPKKIKKINYIKIIKIAVGSSAAIVIADFFGLKYSASAGIITLLSIQDTKKETLLVAGKRFVAFLLAIAVSFTLFQAFGYDTLTFGMFLLLFITGSYLFRLQDGIAMCSVLVTHFLIEQNMKAGLLVNEICIMAIGTLLGVLLNLYMPDKKGAILSDMGTVEAQLKSILKQLADCIALTRAEDREGSRYQPPCKNNCRLEEVFEKLNKDLQDALSRAYDNMNNTLLSDTRYYLQYFTMRRSQLTILMHIQKQLCLLTLIPPQARPISDFMLQIAEQFHEYNNAEALLKDLMEIKEEFKKEPNPGSREEFENRAVLYLILYDLENFLTIKKNFVANISQKQIETFWNRV